MNTIADPFCPLETPYVTPAGYYDQAFIYAFNGTQLTNAQSYFDLAIPVEQDSSFIVRRIAGLESIASTLFWKDANRRYQSSAPYTWLGDLGIVPEVEFPRASQIAFDLGTVSKSVNQNGQGGINVDRSQILFQGVKRFKGEVINKTRYRYYERPFIYTQDLVFNTLAFVDPTSVTSSRTAPQLFIQQVNNYDFELQYFAVSGYTDEAYAQFQVMLFDSGQKQLFNIPVNLYQLMTGNAAGADQNGVFPVPSVLYQVGTEIRFALTSLQTDIVPGQTYQITFQGVQRIPY